MKKQNDYELRKEYDLSKMTALARGHFEGIVLYILLLSDGREISLPIDQMNWLKWLANATQEQRAKWTIEPGGFAVYWQELDDGFEIEHLLSLQPLA